MRTFKRSQRIADQIKRDVSEILAEMLRDKSELMVTVSTVEVTDDLAQAKIFYTVLDDNAEKLKTVKEYFVRATAHIQAELARRLRIRRLPEISLHYDKSLVEGLRMTALIDKVMSEESHEED
ncbi:MAG: 30S ribosome-binding factor RbfA [FCB group bacterium]|nr:30S ribosome-binding factor RbfA [FCB group bacterium]